MQEIEIHTYTPPDRTAERAAARKAKFFLRPDPADAKATDKWLKSPIAGRVSGREIVRWLWESGQQTCALCNQDVDITLEKPHPAAAQPDHIVPWDRDRDLHVWGNVRVTHAVCNQSRNAGRERTTEQYLAAMDRAMLAHRSGKPIPHMYERMRDHQRAARGQSSAVDGLEALLSDPSSPSWQQWSSREEVEEALARQKRMLWSSLHAVESYEAYVERVRAEVAARE